MSSPCLNNKDFWYNIQESKKKYIVLLWVLFEFFYPYRLQKYKIPV